MVTVNMKTQIWLSVCPLQHTSNMTLVLLILSV